MGSMAGKKTQKELDEYLARVAERLERLIASDEYGGCMTADCDEITRHASGFCRICRVRTCRRCQRGFTLGSAIDRPERQELCAQCAKVKSAHHQGGENSDE